MAHNWIVLTFQQFFAWICVLNFHLTPKSNELKKCFYASNQNVNKTRRNKKKYFFMNFWTLFFTFSIKMDTTQSLSDSAMISVRLITMDSYMNSPSQDSSNDFDPVYSMVWFIRYFHQSRIPNIRNVLTNIY